MRTITMALTVAAALAGTACYTMRPVSVADLGALRTARVWITRPDQSVIVINDAKMFRGKLVGFVDGKYHELPPEGFQQMRVRTLATARTASLLAAGALGFTVAVVLAAGGEDHFDPCAGGEEECEGAPATP